jgi:CheY-like chemotaxis protein/two-component sensor histidine kinase
MLSMKDRVSKIKGSADTLLDIINGILDISKIESGELKLENTPFDFNDIINTCKSILTPTVEDKGIDFIFNVEPIKGGALVGDPIKLRQIILNLLSNAVKFTDRGFVEFTSIITKQSGERITIRIEVKDSGIGMDSEKISNVFLPFVQSDVSTTRKYGGTGLGLAISKSYVELMGGNLSVESAPGIGSRFSFTVTFDTTVEISSVKKVPVIEKPMFSGEVLLCEDNPANQEVAIDHLAMVGLKTILAENGHEGLIIIEERMKSGKTFDLILMDIYMPVMDGIEATKKLVEMGIKTPIIAVTANVLPEDREKYLKAGMADCLSKPFKQRDLWACLMKYLKPVSTSELQSSHHEGKSSEIIDMALGIENSANNEASYKRILSNFFDKQREIYEQMESSAKNHDYNQAHMMAHKEKNVAAIIGAVRLAEILNELEKVYKNGGADYPHDLMDAYNEELAKVLDYISSYNAHI